MKTVTVIVPIFGDIDYWMPLAYNAVRSVLRQTIKPKAVFISQGETMQDARNAALEVETDFIIFLDADDELDPGYVEAMLNGEGDIRVPSVHRIQDRSVSKDQKHYQPKDLLTGNYIVIGAMIRTELFKAVGGFGSWPLYEDWDLWLRCEESLADIQQCTNAIYKINVRKKSRNEPSATVKIKYFEEIKLNAYKRRKLL